MKFDNLNHPIFEVKERAINRLLQKLSYGIWDIKEFVDDASFMPKILILIQDDSMIIKKCAIDLLHFILRDQKGCTNFRLLGGFMLLQNLQASVPIYLEEKISALLKSNESSHYESSADQHSILDGSKEDTSNNNDVNESYIWNLESNGVRMEEKDLNISYNVKNSSNTSLYYGNPILFNIFPWLTLTQLDNKILESTARSLIETNNMSFIGVLLFCQSILFKDFPIEILLQRPFIMQVLLSNLAEPEHIEAWRKQEFICLTLESFNKYLVSRLFTFDSTSILHHTDSSLHSKFPKDSSLSMNNLSETSSRCCSKKFIFNSHIEADIQGASIETIHESDDEDEFFILKVNQLGIVNWCCQLMTLSFYLVDTPYTRLSSALLRLIPTTMDILRSCINVQSLWFTFSNEVQVENIDIVKEVSSSLLRGFNFLSKSIDKLYKEREDKLSSVKAEEVARKLKIASAVFIAFTKLFAPVKNLDVIFGNQEIIALSYLLSDVGVYSEYPQDHCRLLAILREVNEGFAIQIDALIKNISKLESCKKFLQVSSSETDKFQQDAENSIPIIFIHRSKIYVEKVVRGLAKQVAASDVTELQISKARKLIVQLLLSPDDQSKVLGYRAVYNLITENVGITQAKNTTRISSKKILVLLHPRIINLLIFSGCVNSNAEIVEFCQNSILSLLRGFHLMASSVLSQVVECFSSCLLNLQNLAGSETVLGRAILDLPYQLLKLTQHRDIIEPTCKKFHLKCLFSRDVKVREQAMRNCLALLVTSNSTTFISPTLAESHLDYSNLLALNPSVDIFTYLPINNMDLHHLRRSLQILENETNESSILESAWSQICFLLHNPLLHHDLEKVWPIKKAKDEFLTMMKLSGGRGLTVSHVPLALEVLRLRAAYSSDVRLLLSNDLTFLMVTFRALLFFKTDPRVHLEISLLWMLLLNEDVIIQSKIPISLDQASKSSFCTIAFPKLVSSTNYIAMIHENYNWEPDDSLDSSTRELYSMLCSENLKIPTSPSLFYKSIWAVICADDHSELSVPFDYSQNFSNLFFLSKSESTLLRTSLSKSFIWKTLLDIENATTHKNVKESLNIVESALILLEDDFGKIKDVLQSDKWAGALSRFFLCMPSTSLDRQILYHVMNVVKQILKLIYLVFSISNDSGCLCCSIVHLLISEYSQEQSPLASLIRLTGNVECDPLSLTSENLQSSQMFQCLVINASKLLKLRNLLNCECHKKNVNWELLGLNVAKILISTVKMCKMTPKYNLVILLPSLECLIQIAEECYIQDLMLVLIPLLIDLQMSFHIGRGRAHNAYLGRAVSLRCLILLSLIVSSEKTPLKLENLICMMEEEVSSMPWLLASLEHSDQNLVAAGLKLILALSYSVQGAKALDQSFEELSGGIWILVMKFFIREDFNILSKIFCIQILTNLCNHATYLPTSEIPWQSLSIIDIQTDERATGMKAFSELLKLFDIYSIFRLFFNSILPLPEDEDDKKITLPPLFDSDEMKDFVTSEESRWASISDDLEENYKGEVTPQLLEACMQLLTNLLVIDFPTTLELCVKSHAIHALVKHFSLLTNEVKINSKWNNVIEYGFNILLIIGESYSQNTHLSSLCINLFLTDYSPNDNVLKSSMRILSHMVCFGGWGSVRVLELLNLSRDEVFKHVIRFLHHDCLYKEDAVAFVGALCQAGINKSISEPVVSSSLKSLFDSSLHLGEDKEKKFIGWEICRHLIQLLPAQCEVELSLCYSIQKENLNLRFILEGLKLLFSISESGRCCAYFHSQELLLVIQYSLTNLREKILSVNLNITSNLFLKKEFKNDILFATHCLQVATNWLLETSVQQMEFSEDSSDFVLPLKVGEALIPLLHPLWVPAQRALPLLEAMLQFLVTATSHSIVCPVLTRTSILPGALLSSSRTTKSLLVSIVTSVSQVLVGTKSSFSPLTSSLELLTDTLDIILNSSNVHDCAYVVVKEGIMGNVIKYLNDSKELNSLVAQKCVSIIATLTFHKEARLALIKIPAWIKCLKTCCCVNKVLQKLVLISYTNMIRNEQVVKNMLTTEYFLRFIANFVTEISNSITRNHSTEMSDEDIHVILLCLWGLVANNQRCKTILKKLNVIPDLLTLRDNNKHPVMCQMILKIIKL